MKRIYALVVPLASLTAYLAFADTRSYAAREPTRISEEATNEETASRASAIETDIVPVEDTAAIAAINCSSEDGMQNCACQEKCCRGHSWCNCDRNCR